MVFLYLLGSRMGAKDNVKSGGVIPFDHKDKEKTNHDKAQMLVSTSSKWRKRERR